VLSTSKNSNELEYVRMKLPKHLVRWLRIVSRQYGMDIQQLVTYILEMYKGFWEAGVRYNEEKISDVEAIMQDYEDKLKHEELSDRTVKEHVRMARKFIRWCLENNIDLRNITWENVEEYLLTLNISKSTKSTYKSSLLKFLSYLETIVEYKSHKANQ